MQITNEQKITLKPFSAPGTLGYSASIPQFITEYRDVCTGQTPTREDLRT